MNTPTERLFANAPKQGPTVDHVLDFLRAYIAAEGWAPTLREIARAVGLQSVATVSMHLRTLERRGDIERLRFSPRAIRMVPR